MDTLIAHLPIVLGKEPDWTATRGALAGTSDEALEDLASYLRTIDAEGAQAAVVRAALGEVIDRVEQAISDGSRELATIEVPGWLIHLTGGGSWGDSPTELFDDFCDLEASRLSEAAGFYL
jgi:hypothetical protein